MKVTNRDIDSILPYINNPRKNDGAVEYVAKSIKAYGFKQPIVVDKDLFIIVGHTRYFAAKSLGLKEVPVLIADDLSDEQVKAYRIADNKVSEFSSWDMDLLSIELEDLDNSGFDLDLTGFDEDEIEKILLKNADGSMPDLPEGDKEGFVRMTFIVSDEQAEQIHEALEKAKDAGEFVDTGNDNSNGNALSRVCEWFNGQG